MKYRRNIVPFLCGAALVCMLAGGVGSYDSLAAGLVKVTQAVSVGVGGKSVTIVGDAIGWSEKGQGVVYQLTLQDGKLLLVDSKGNVLESWGGK